MRSTPLRHALRTPGRTPGRETPGPRPAPARTLRTTAAVVVALLGSATLAACSDSPPDEPETSVPVAAPHGCSYDDAYNAVNAMTSDAIDPANFRADSTDPGAVAAVTNNPYATKAACDVLLAGGTAADAAVTAQYVLGLVEPQSSGPGGGALVTYLDGRTGDVTTYDGTVHAPSGEREDLRSVSTLQRAGVPQTDRVMHQLAHDHGSRPVPDLVAPAVRLARSGFTVSPRLADAAASRPDLFAEDAEGEFLTVGGRAPVAGDTVRNPAYADYLDAVAADGPGVTDVIEALLTAHGRASRGGRDLVRDWRDDAARPLDAAPALCAPYAGHEVCGSPSTATGMMIVAEALQLLDHKHVARLTPDTAGDGPAVPRATAVHLISEAERIAFADGNTWMSDPGDNPDRSRAYLDSVVTNRGLLEDRSGDIRQKRTMDTPQPSPVEGEGEYEESTEEGTSQIVVRDVRGDIADITTTLQQNFGAGIAGQGFFLNNSLDNFSRHAEAGEPNHRGPGLHPRTTMAPVIVVEGGVPRGTGHPEAIALGSPGGRGIPAYVIKSLVAVLEWGLPPDEAIRMPNFGAEGRDIVFMETGGDLDDADFRKVRDLLGDWGQDVNTGPRESGTAVVRVGRRGVHAGADPRRQGLALGAPLPAQQRP
ncbi:gamma-glutamyltransferase [Corynebacterium bovis]|uniref:gamma-glutamyltransferase n=1 Tax=Corynebacterium bovis TaxID=36808 RepID=UPI00254A26CE|nr:gamma-glutamyltransferase [Corynebacterium bovis]MDK8510194.1 gamma-glutamyltransferase [Corynebacterium bovis]